MPGEAAPQLTSSSSRSGLSSAVAARMLRPPSSATPRASAQHTGVRGPVKLSAAAPRTRSCFHLRRATLNTSTAVSAVTSSLQAAAAESCSPLASPGLTWPRPPPARSHGGPLRMRRTSRCADSAQKPCDPRPSLALLLLTCSRDQVQVSPSKTWRVSRAAPRARPPATYSLFPATTCRAQLHLASSSTH